MYAALNEDHVTATAGKSSEWFLTQEFLLNEIASFYAVEIHSTAHADDITTISVAVGKLWITWIFAFIKVKIVTYFWKGSHIAEIQPASTSESTAIPSTAAVFISGYSTEIDKLIYNVINFGTLI